MAATPTPIATPNPAAAQTTETRLTALEEKVEKQAEELKALRVALVGAFRAMFYTAAAFCVVGAVLTTRVPLQRF